MNMMIPTITELEMTASQIAKLTKKELSNVTRDVKNMIVNLSAPRSKVELDTLKHELNRNIDPSKLKHEHYQQLINTTKGMRVVVDNNRSGYFADIFMDYEHTLCLVMSYSMPLTMLVIKRWKELELKSKDNMITQSIQSTASIQNELMFEVISAHQLSLGIKPNTGIAPPSSVVLSGIIFAENITGKKMIHMTRPEEVLDMGDIGCIPTEFCNRYMVDFTAQQLNRIFVQHKLQIPNPDGKGFLPTETGLKFCNTENPKHYGVRIYWMKSVIGYMRKSR